MLVFTTVAAAVIVSVASVPYNYYRSRYDHLDVTTILNNRRMVNYYAKCLLSEGPCPPEGQEFKRILPEALETNCARCTEKQKTVAYLSIKRLKKEYPKIWDQLSAVWDPDGSYVEKFLLTFENRLPSIKPPTVDPAVLSNRFGENESDNDEGQQLPQIPSYVSTSTTTTSTTIKPVSTSTSRPFNIPTSRPFSTSTNRPFSTSTSSTTTRRTTSTPPTVVVLTKITNRPTNTVINPPRPQQFPGIAANIQATVSFGTNVVGGIVRGLGDLGQRVVETSQRVVQNGAKIANQVLSAVVRI